MSEMDELRSEVTKLRAIIEEAGVWLSNEERCTDYDRWCDADALRAILAKAPPEGGTK